MRKRIRLSVIGLVVVLLAAITNSFAAAATWPVDISELQSGPIVSGTDGSITALRCDYQQSSKPIAETRSASGQRVNTVRDQTTGCAFATVGAGHTIYSTASQQESPYAEYTVASRDNKQLWKTPWLETCEAPNERLSALNVLWREAGPDKHLYEILSGGGCGTAKLYLHKVNTSTGHEVYRRQLDTGMFAKAMMTRLGVVLLVNNPAALHYYGLSDSKITTVPLDASLSYNASGAADDGRFYTANEERVDPRGACPDLQFQTTALAGYDRLGKFFEYRFVACKRVMSVAPTSNGVVVVSAVDGAGQSSVVSFYPNGTKRIMNLPQKRQDGKWFYPWYNSLIADTKGNVVLRRMTYSDENMQDNTYSETYDLLNSQSLVSLATVQTDALSSAYTAPMNIGVAMSPGRLYVALNEKCQPAGGCPRKLYAVAFGDVGFDYPRGAVLESSAVKQHYNLVALGDSFSSGEGNESFIAPSDKNGCHRSNAAYPVLLEKDASLKFRLQAFRACSGARTWEIAQGRNGESAQTNSITQDTDVVTVTIGGNDVGFAEFVRTCLEPPVVSGEPCVEGSQSYTDIMANIGRLSTGLNNAFGTIQTKIGPSTRVLVIGYPFVIREHVTNIFCRTLVSQKEQQAAEKVAMSLDEAISTTVTRLRDKRFHHVGSLLTSSPFSGHDLCSASSFFYNWPQSQQVYITHPDQNGQRAYATLVKQYWKDIS